MKVESKNQNRGEQVFLRTQSCSAQMFDESRLRVSLIVILILILSINRVRFECVFDKYFHFIEKVLKVLSNSLIFGIINKI